MSKDWSGVRLPAGLIEQIEKYLKTDDAKKRGFHTVSGYVTHAVRKELGLG